MGVKFSIKNTQSKAEMEGDFFLRFSGVSEPFTHSSEREATKIGVDGSGNPKIVFTTGLSDKQVDFYKWYSDEEKKAVKKQIKDLSPIVTNYYGGSEVVAETNRYFWEENRDVNKLSLSNHDINAFYDTENPVHALLYLSIISGAYMDIVAPTKDWADRRQIPHYLSLESENSFEGEDDITKSDAHAALGDLRKNAEPDALFILAWCIQFDTNAFGAYLKNTSIRDLVQYHIKYIDGKIVTKKKRNTPATFLEYYNKWNGQQTRPALIIEAYVKAGLYFNFLQEREKVIVTHDGVELGRTIPDAVSTLQKAKYSQDLEKLRDQVEAKWKE